MTTSSIKEIWKLIEKFKDEVELLTSDEALVLLIYINRHKGITKTELIEKVKKHFKQVNILIDTLLSTKFIEGKNGLLYLSRKGEEIVKVIEYSKYDISELPKDAIRGYSLQTPPLGSGSTSVTFRATKEKTEFDVVLKIFKPGILDHVDFGEKIKTMRPFVSVPHLVIPQDYGEFKWNGLNLKYIEIKYIKGDSLGKFLNENRNVDLEETLRNFIKEVAGTLKIIQNKGFTHGDLHENNILMVEDEVYKGGNIFHFEVIDFIGINSNEKFRRYELTDLEYFKENFFKITRKYASTPSGKVDRKKLGERLVYIYNNLVENKYNTFDDVIKGLSEKLPERKRFQYEPPFTYLIFETYDVNDPLWLKRFELEATIYEYFIDFRPLICSGPRGCGKTIYLRSLSFIPKLIKVAEDEEDVKNKIAYFKGIFGIYFACRQGEFKIFSEKCYKFTFETQLFLKHILILKILRRTISLIGEAYSEKVFTSEPKVELILDILSQYLTKELTMTSTFRERPFKELISILRNEENFCIDMVGKEEEYPPTSNLLQENILIEFFQTIKKAVSELSDAKFYVIFDDLSEPQVNLEMQKILNCLIACHNEVYCCKFSTDKYAYTFQDMYGKALQVPHDYTYRDMSNVEDYEKYLEKIINRQLEIGGYTKKIKDYLEELPYSHKELINLLSKREYNKVKYGGWNLIVQLSSWSVRDGLVICEAIFKQYGGREKHNKLKEGKDKIFMDVQDKAIRKYSNEAYGYLINIEYVGKEIFDVVRSFGEISREYLKREITKEKERKHEVITIERRDNKELSVKAEDLLRKLIRHSVFIDRGHSFSREQIGRVEKFTLHRKYTPELKTTYREREHLRLSKDRLEEFLLRPDQFREKFFKKGKEDKYQLKFFDFEEGDKNE
ncbi:protein kinase [Patescibacteria group bacterium]|nr:protein kinase [Patescibacteria group bacterium]